MDDFLGKMICCVLYKKFKKHIPVCKTVSVPLCVKYILFVNR